MSALAEFLRTEGKEIARLAADRQQILDEWRRDVEAFLELVRRAVEAADPDRVLFLMNSSVYLREQRLGGYELPALGVVLGKFEVRVEPVARFNAGSVFTADGNPGRPIQGTIRIQVGKHGFRYSAHRLTEGDGFVWVIVDDDRRQVRPATVEVIQDVVLKLFK